MRKGRSEWEEGQIRKGGSREGGREGIEETYFCREI